MCENPLAISFRLLLGLYSIIPVCLILQGLDSVFWGGYLQQALPSSPKHFLLFQILFGTPHIIASTILTASNREYLKTFKIKILTMTFLLAVFFGVGSQVLSYRTLYILVASWTVYHVIKQQYGIARGVCRLSNWQFYLLLWLSIAAGILIYIGIFLNKVLDPGQAEAIRRGAAVFCAALVVCAVIVQDTAPNAFGKSFLWANILMVLSSFYLYTQQYYFLAILVPRLIHDATAYVFYVTHDYNRHHDAPKNFIYRFASRLKINIFIVLPLLSFGLAFLLQQYGDYYFNVMMQFLFGVEIRKAVTLVVLGYLALMHYYMESFTWKGDSPYRRYISFTR
ncbi:MAG: hypothetical protein ACU833_00665 [Gammaproteobacteria bacterium]